MVLLASHRFPDGETSLLDKKARLVIFKRLNNALSKIYFNSHLSFIPYLCSGVCFSLSFMCKSAPFLQSILTISMSPFMAAICNGVISVVLRAFTWAPCFRQSSTDGTLPVSTAKWSGRSWSKSGSFKYSLTLTLLEVAEEDKECKLKVWSRWEGSGVKGKKIVAAEHWKCMSLVVNANWIHCSLCRTESLLVVSRLTPRSQSLALNNFQ